MASEYEERKHAVTKAIETAFTEVTLVIGGLASLLLMAYAIWGTDSIGDARFYAGASLIAAFVAMLNMAHRINKLDAKMRPKIRVECGSHKPNSVYRNRKAFNQLGAEIPDYSVDFFGFTITNDGAQTLRDCRSLLTRIEKEGVLISDKIGSLPFEARDKGFDLIVVDIPQFVPQPCAVFSIDSKNKLMIGSFENTWRHDSFTDLTAKHGNGKYRFFVKIAAHRMDTIELVFETEWKGDRATSDIAIGKVVGTETGYRLT